MDIHEKYMREALREAGFAAAEDEVPIGAVIVWNGRVIAKKSGKLLMFAFVTRFRNHLQMLKKYIDSGKMGKIISAECYRVNRCLGSDGWFTSREKGGGCLIDSGIHELDNALYLMGYPKVKAVLGFTSDANINLPSKM